MDGFKKFLLRGNVVDLAVAVVIGAAFTKIVTAVVTGIITPLVAAIGGGGKAFVDKSFSLNGQDIKYGSVIDAAINFLIVAAIVYFLVVQPVQKLMDRRKTEPETLESTKECPECLSSIPAAAARCAFCTVEQLDVTA